MHSRVRPAPGGSFDGEQPHPSNIDATASELLKLYLKSTKTERQELFACTSDTADRYGISQRTLQRLVNQRLIAAIPFGKKKYYVYLISVEAYLQGCATERDAS